MNKELELDRAIRNDPIINGLNKLLFEVESLRLSTKAIYGQKIIECMYSDEYARVKNEINMQIECRQRSIINEYVKELKK